MRWRALLLGLLLPVLSHAAGGHVFPARGEIEVAFSPGDHPETMIVDALGKARRAVYVQAYLLTSRPIAEALVAAKARGVDVQVLADAQMNRRGGRALERLLAGGVPLAFETRYNAAHNKVILVDPKDEAHCVVFTGSYNFTLSARDRNAENLVAIRGHAGLARSYLENWQRHRADATVVKRLPWSR